MFVYLKKIPFQLIDVYFWLLFVQSTTPTDAIANTALKAEKSVSKWGHKTPT